MGEAKQVTGPGSFAELIGGGASALHSIYCMIDAGGTDQLITRIAVSYADDNHGTPDLCGRLLVLREPMPAPDEMLDPAGIDSGSSAPKLNIAFDHFITRKGLVDCLRTGDSIKIPKGEKYYVLLTSAYSPLEGPFGGGPDASEKRAKLTVMTQPVGAKPYRVETY